MSLLIALRKANATSVIFLFTLSACNSPDLDTDASNPIPPPPVPTDTEKTGFHNILPPGQKGVFNSSEAAQANAGAYPENTIDQLEMFEKLLTDNVVPGFQDSQLEEYFKASPITIAPEDIGREYRPGDRDDVVVYRDKTYNVPHVVGETREGTTFASGYVTAEDRLFLMEILRAVGKARMAEFLGPAESNIEMDRNILSVAPYKPDEYQQMFEALKTKGAAGLQAVADFESYTAGINQFIEEARNDPNKLPAEYPALQKTPEDWQTSDIAALGAVIGAFFGKGGGNELRNFCALQTMQNELGDVDTAREIFDDLMFLDDPESPRHVEQSFPYQTDLGALNPASLPEIDCATLKPIDENGPGVEAGPEGVFNTMDAITGTNRANGEQTLDLGSLGTIDFNLPNSMSNALLVTKDKAINNKPISVMGPQLSFFMPQIFVEKCIIGPGIRARGAGFPGTDVYIEIGRGDNFAWSATTSRADVIDHFVLNLCDPAGGSADIDSMGYQRGADCIEIEEFTHTEVAVPTGGGAGAPTVLEFKIQRSEHYGPLIARGLLKDGTPVAVASHRSTYFDELDSILAFQLVNDPDFMANGNDEVAGGAEAFREALSKLDYVFNWLYLDENDIAYQHSCKCPKRANGTDPMLPTLGDGNFDWAADYLTKDQNPNVTNPTSGYLSSWNNKQAPGWGTADDNPWWGPAFRPVFFEEGIAEALAEPQKITRGRLVDINQQAATKDLRSDQLVPLMTRIMGATAPTGSDARAEAMMAKLVEWESAGSQRIDRDNNGEYEHPQAAAIIDAWWNHLVDTVFNSRTGNFLTNLGFPLHQAPQLGQGFAFGFGPYSHFHKDFRQILGDQVTGAFSRTYCGDGNLEACKNELWQSLEDSIADLETEFESANIDDWKRTVADDSIRHSAAGVVNVPATPFQNRPTFQLVTEVGAE